MLAKIRNSTASAAIPGTEENVAIAEHLAKVHAYVHTASARVAEASGALRALRAELAVMQGRLEAALALNHLQELIIARLKDKHGGVHDRLLKSLGTATTEPDL
jgi:thioredoxin-like negative regulator of GroEL